MEDDIVMYLIINQDLNMSIGKTAAQVGHAVKAVVSEMDWYTKPGFVEWITNPKIQQKGMLYNEWSSGLEKMVCLRANTNQFNKIKEIYKDQCGVAVDAGLTEVEPGSETVICLFPMRKSSRDKALKRLQVL